MRILTWYCIVISSTLLALPVTQCKAESLSLHTTAEIADSGSDYSPSDKATTLERFSGVAGMLNEVEERRRTAVYTPYPGLASKGVVHELVHVSDGSLAFARLDLVVRSDMPITIRRAYNSKRLADSNFGLGGWRLTIAEEIHPDFRAGTFQYVYGNNLGVAFSSDGELISPIEQVTTDISDIRFEGLDAVQVELRTGTTKLFVRRGDKFVIKTVTDEIGNSQRFEYDDFGLSRIIAGETDFVDIERDADGLVLSFDSSDGRSVKYSYSDLGSLLSVLDVRGETWRYQYDQNSFLTNAITPMGTSTLKFQHDESGRILNTSINGKHLEFRYGDFGTIVEDKRGREIRFESDVQGLTTRITNWVGTVSSVKTNKNGQPKMLMRNDEMISHVRYKETAKQSSPATQTIRHIASGRNVTLNFDDRGRVTSFQSYDPGTSYRVAGYSYAMTPTEVVFSDNTKIRFGADTAGNPKQIQLRDKTTLDFKWSDAAVRIAVENETAALAFDEHGQLTRLSPPGDTNIDYTYGPGGFRETTTVSDGTRINYQYNPAGTLIYTETALPNEKIETFVYDVGPNEMLRQISGSGVDGHHVFGYTTSGRVGSIDSTVMNSFSFLYDDQDRLEVAIPNGFEPIIYEYAQGEADVVSQLDNRTRAEYGQKWDTSEFSARFEQLYTRTTASQIGMLTYDEILGEIVPAIRPEGWLPSNTWLAAISNMKLLSLFGRTQPAIFSFSMPSNRLFVPAEYWAVNCCYCCPISEVMCDIP